MSENQTEVVKFLNYLSNPNALSNSDLSEIKDWITKYPYSQSLKFIAVKASQKNSNYQELLNKAATIAPSRKLLHDLIHQPESFNSTVLPFNLEDDQTIEERQIAVAQEEANPAIEDQSNFAFGIDINEIFGSDFKPEKVAEEKVLETVTKLEVDHIKVETKEEITASADEKPLEGAQETQSELEVKNTEEEIKEEVQENESELEVEHIEEEILKEEVLDSAEEGIKEEVEETETEVKYTEEEIIKEEVLTSADEEIKEEVEKTETELEVKDIEEEIIKEEVLVSANEEIKEEVEETETELEVKNTEEKTQEESIKEEASASADVEDNETEQESTIENIEEVISEEKVKASAEVEVKKAETELEVENIEAESKEVILEEEASASANEEIKEEVQKTETELEVENIEKETKKEEPAFQYAPQTDFFALNRKDKVEEKQIAEVEIKTDDSVSAYNDERLPYTFLWWLNKTRKEHATNFQPYSSFQLDISKQIKKQQSDGLNHQIAENIFHLRGVEELSSSAANYTVPFDFRKKEFQIIEKFIKEEPQIRPPAANKIDAENKAKKSSEDKNQVVSETLAKIYVEQMLYHKALDVYKKLSLKFPEKSTYFASQIKYLELKVN